MQLDRKPKCSFSGGKWSLLGINDPGQGPIYAWCLQISHSSLLLPLSKSHTVRWQLWSLSSFNVTIINSILAVLPEVRKNSDPQMSEWQLNSAECWWIFTLKKFSHKDYCNLLYAAFFAGLKWMRCDDKYKCAERKKGWFFTLKASIIPLQGMYFCIPPSR